MTRCWKSSSEGQIEPPVLVRARCGGCCWAPIAIFCLPHDFVLLFDAIARGEEEEATASAVTKCLLDRFGIVP